MRRKYQDLWQTVMQSIFVAAGLVTLRVDTYAGAEALLGLTLMSKWFLRLACRGYASTIRTLKGLMTELRMHSL